MRDPLIDDNDLAITISRSDRTKRVASIPGDVGTVFSMPQMSAQSLWEIQDRMSSSDVYSDMSSAFDYCKSIVFPQKLAEFRAALWSRGFQVSHPHPDVERAYRQFCVDFDIQSLVTEGMLHLSICNNACLIWRVKTTGKIEYVKFYRPDQTRIDPIRNSLWCKPADDFIKLVRGATDAELREYVRKFGKDSAVKEWVAVAKGNLKPSPFPGFVRLVNNGLKSDRDHWIIFPGNGGNSQTTYSPVNMRSIFLDLELVKLLYQGDWSTAWMIKNMIVLVQAGESITSGPLAGSRRNYVTAKDLEALKATFQKAGKAQIVYGNHTIKISFNAPDPNLFGKEKYDSVIDRICWFFGIGRFLLLGGADSTSYATAAWNVHAIRTDAKRVRDLFKTYFTKFLTHDSIVQLVFKGMSDIKDYCVKSVDKNVITLRKRFKGLSLENVGDVEYSTDGFITVQKYQIASVSAENGTITTIRNLPDGANSNNVRLSVPLDKVLALYGPPLIKFDERIIKDDQVTLRELQMLINQGPISNRSLLEELGFDFDTQVAQKKLEWDMWKDLIPMFEPRQGIVAAIAAKLQDLIINGSSPQGEGGRPFGSETDDFK